MNEDSVYDFSQRTQVEELFKDASRIVVALNQVVRRHTSPTGEYPVAVAELRNIINPGCAPMYPADQGHTATCELCCPKGNGAKWGKPWPPEPNP